MKNDEINRTIKECFKSLDYRDNEIAKLNFNNLSLIDKNIEILENISFSLSESSLKLSFISKEIPEHSEQGLEHNAQKKPTEGQLDLLKDFN